MADAHLIPAERIEKAILIIRGQKVMLDRDLARLYGVPTKALNQAVSRNRTGFPTISCSSFPTKSSRFGGHNL